MNDFLVSIVVPCYNEAENIASLILRLESTLDKYRHEIILVNDGSTDETQREIEHAASINPFTRYIFFQEILDIRQLLKLG